MILLTWSFVVVELVVVDSVELVTNVRSNYISMLRKRWWPTKKMPTKLKYKSL